MYGISLSDVLPVNPNRLCTGYYSGPILGVHRVALSAQNEFSPG